MIRKIRNALAMPFIVAATVLLIIAFIITAEGWDDTFAKWMTRRPQDRL